MRLSQFLFATAVVSVAVVYGAQSSIESKTDCQAAQTTADMRACENARYEKAERELSAAYERLMSRLDPVARDKLRLAQRAWLKFREAQADFRADAARGGTLAPLIRITVWADMTEARTADLRQEPNP
jgi:uncharacterized protein YecT (DUF1311 family)